MSNHNTTSPTPAPSDSGEDAVCTNLIPYFFYAQSGLSVILFLCVVAITMQMRKPPPTNAKIVNYGRTWMHCLLFFSCCFWISLPLTAMYLMYRFVLPPSILPYGHEIACIEISYFPYTPLHAIFVGWTLVGTNHKLMLDQLGDIINNTDDIGGSEVSKEPKVLMMGGTGYGLFFVDALSKVPAEMMFIDYSGIRNYIINNALATNPFFSPAEANELKILDPSSLGCEKLGIPLEDSTVDKIVVCPGFRKTEPIGGCMVEEEERMPRMAAVFREAIRVLKPGATINIYDEAMDSVLAEADLRDLGCDGIEIIDTEVRVGESSETAGTAYYHVLWRKEGETAPSKVSCDASYGDSYNQGGETQVAQFKSMEAGLLFDVEDESRRPRVSQSTRTVLMGCYQFVIYILLVTLATALYKEIRFPLVVGPYGTVSNLLLTIANNYPMMAYVARVMMRCETQKKGRGHAFDDIKKVIIKNCRFDFKALLYSAGWSTFVWVLVFLFQLLMGAQPHKNMFGDIRASLAINACVTAIIVGVVCMLYLYVRPRMKRRALSKLRNIPEEKWAMNVGTASTELSSIPTS